MSMTRSGFYQVRVDVWVTVEEGALRVYLIDPEGIETGEIIRPGQATTISGDVEANYESFRVYFQALDEEAKGIEYVVDYTYP